MTDTREALVALLGRPDHAPMSTHDPRDGSCQSCPWPLHEMPPEGIADAILAEFDVTPRGVHNHDIDPACPETRLPDGSLRGECTTDATERGKGVTIQIGGRYMGKAQALAQCVADEVMKRGGSVTVTSLPSVEALADALAAEGIDAEPGEPDLTPLAERLLAMLPGRTEAEVYREGYDQGLRDAASASRSEAEVKAEAWDKGYMTGYRDRSREESYDLGANPYRQKEATRG